MTAHYLTHSTYPLKSGDTCLVHAAAGGAGGLIVQMAKMLGARVLGTVSTEAKAQVAREHGADEVILYTQQDFEAETRRLTGGRGVDVVYDSVGRTTFEKSLGSLRPRGTLALFGQSSGPVPPFDPSILNAKGSLLPHASQPGPLPADARRTALARRRRTEFDRRRQTQTAHGPRLPPGRCRGGAPRSRRAPHHRQTAAHRPINRMTLQAKLTLGTVLLATVIVAVISAVYLGNIMDLQFESALRQAAVWPTVWSATFAKPQ